jgi:hypothetical protein
VSQRLEFRAFSATIPGHTSRLQGRIVTTRTPADSTVIIRIDGQHASIKNLTWQGAPPFAVVTGLNGAGKSQLLEVIAEAFGALKSNAGRSEGDFAANVYMTGPRLTAGEVFHSYGEWPPIEADSASEDQIKGKREAVAHVWASRNNPQ